ncbi:hypothetical protein NDU88_007505 [Pleurodeles waltl]|uniref:Uncharacterized protein n=1 Tax=Pleurodeles waltl TaxID=8319 RepID=A0AAV7RSM1_PLEWA|nr:hypothetical protein NDU88_007505 [Pleurodeles waltl]
MNRMVKGTIQLAVQGNQNVSSVVQEAIWAHRTTQLRDKGRTPFEFMRGRKARSKLVPGSLEGDRIKPRDQVEMPQTAGYSGVQVGDWVKVKDGSVGAGWTKFRSPFEVKHVGHFNVVLANGTKWNKRRVALYQKGGGSAGNLIISNGDGGCSGLMLFEGGVERLDADTSHENENRAEVLEGQTGVENEENKTEFKKGSGRVRRPPAYLNDYVRDGGKLN